MKIQNNIHMYEWLLKEYIAFWQRSSDHFHLKDML